MAYADPTTFAPILKTLYTDEAIRRATYQKRPILALLPKNTGIGGSSYNSSLIFANSQNRSVSYTEASTVRTYTQSKQWAMTLTKNYSFGQVDNFLIQTSKTNPMAFAKTLETETDSALASLSDAQHAFVWGDGTGAIAQVSSSQTLSSTTLTLAKPESVVNFECGMSIAFSATAGGAAKSGTAYVVGVDRTAGTLQLSATVDGTATALNTLVATIAASDYIYLNAGDINGTMKGFQAWLPSTVSGSDSFFGVNRSSDRTRLGGIFLDSSTSSIEDALLRAMTLTRREGGSPDYLWVNSNYETQIMYAFQSRVQYVNVNSPDMPTLGFGGMRITSPGLGNVTIMMDPRVPDGEAYLLQMDTWELQSAGEFVTLFDTDGQVYLRDSTTDSVLFRAHSYAQLACKAPGYNARIILPS